MRRLILVLATLSIAGLPLGAGDALAACTVDTQPVAFGSVDVTRTTESQGKIALSCSITTNVVVGLASSSAPGQRYMTGPNGRRLTYELYTDATLKVEWGDGSGGGETVPVSNVGEDTQSLTIYGEVPRQDPVPAGAYTDSLTVLVSFQ